MISDLPTHTFSTYNDTVFIHKNLETFVESWPQSGNKNPYVPTPNSLQGQAGQEICLSVYFLKKASAIARIVVCAIYTLYKKN